MSLTDEQLDGIEHFAVALQAHPGYPGWLTAPDKLLALLAEVRALRDSNRELRDFVGEVQELFDGSTGIFPPAIGRWARSLLGEDV